MIEQKETLKQRADEEKERKNALTKDDKEEEKANKKKLSTPFAAYKVVKETTKNPEEFNAKFDLFNENLGDAYTKTFDELSEENIFKRMMADYTEERDEEIEKYREKHDNKDPTYDPADEEKNKINGAEISSVPFEYVDVQFIEKFAKFIKGNSQRMQKYYLEVNEEILKSIKVKETSFESVSKTIALLDKMYLFNSQLEGVFGNSNYNCMGLYNQKGKVVIVSLFDFDHPEKTGLKMLNFLDKFKTTKKVQETIELIIEEERNIKGLL